MNGVRVTGERLGRTERGCLRAVAVAWIGFGLYGLATGAPSTISYLFIVAAVGVGTAAAWTAETPPWLAVGLSALAVAHLAGGLVRVGHDVLYNASLGSPVLRYDHLVHSSGVFLGTVLLWFAWGRRRPGVVLLAVLGGLGLGALNETIEFLTTLAHSGAHVGGYENTGWDLVSNVVGATAAAVVLRRRA